MESLRINCQDDSKASPVSQCSDSMVLNMLQVHEVKRKEHSPSLLSTESTSSWLKVNYSREKRSSSKSPSVVSEPLEGALVNCEPLGNNNAEDVCSDRNYTSWTLSPSEVITEQQQSTKNLDQQTLSRETFEPQRPQESRDPRPQRSQTQRPLDSSLRITKKQFSSVDDLLDDEYDLVEDLVGLKVTRSAPSRPMSRRKSKPLQKMRSFFQSKPSVAASSADSSDEEKSRSQRKDRKKKSPQKLRKGKSKTKGKTSIMSKLLSCASDRGQQEGNVLSSSSEESIYRRAEETKVRRAMMLLQVPQARKPVLDYQQDKQAREQQFEDFCRQHPDFCEPSQRFHYSANTRGELKESLEQFIRQDACHSVLAVIVINGHGNKHGLCLSDDDPVALDDIIQYVCELQDEVHSLGQLPHVVRVVFAQCHGHCYTEPDKPGVEVMCFTSPTMKRTKSSLQFHDLTREVTSSSHHELRTYGSRLSCLDAMRRTIKVEVRIRRRTHSETNMASEDMRLSFLNLIKVKHQGDASVY